MIVYLQGIKEGPLEFYGLTDSLGFGKHEGKTIQHVLAFYPGYIACVLRDQVGFGLDEEAATYYTNGAHSYVYPDEKLPLTETETIPASKELTLTKTIKTFQPILGVNIMKKAILVTHENKYQTGEEAFYGDPGQEYSYLTNLDNLEIDDFVVVDCTNGLQVCRVTKLIGLTPGQIGKAFKWIVSKVDLEQHEQNKLAQEKIQEIQNKVTERKSQIEGQIILKQMAKEDPTMMALLQELGGLDKSLVPAELLLEKPKETETAS